MPSEEVNIVAFLYPKAGKLEELSRYMSELTHEVKATEPDILLYYAYAAEKGNQIVTVEKYRNQAALDSHMKAAHVGEFFKKVSGLLEKPAEVKIAEGGILPGSVAISRL